MAGCTLVASCRSLSPAMRRPLPLQCPPGVRYSRSWPRCMAPTLNRRQSSIKNSLDKLVRKLDFGRSHQQRGHGHWQIARWDYPECQRGEMEIDKAGPPVARRGYRGRQASLLERMGAGLGPPSCFAKMAVGPAFCPDSQTILHQAPPPALPCKRRPRPRPSLKVDARPATASSALPALASKCSAIGVHNLELDAITTDNRLDSQSLAVLQRNIKCGPASCFLSGVFSPFRSFELASQSLVSLVSD